MTEAIPPGAVACKCEQRIVPIWRDAGRTDLAGWRCEACGHTWPLWQKKRTPVWPDA